MRREGQGGVGYVFLSINVAGIWLVLLSPRQIEGGSTAGKNNTDVAVEVQIKNYFREIMSCGKYYESTETLHTLCQNLKCEICLQKCENVTPVACYFIDSYTLPPRSGATFEI